MLFVIGSVIGSLAAIVIILRTPLSPLAIVTVQGESMSPTLRHGDRVLVLRWARPRRAGRLVVVDQPSWSEDRKWSWTCTQATAANTRPPRRLLVKRLAQIVPDGLVVLGDNAGASTDSREFGPVPPKHFYGIVAGRLYAAPPPPDGSAAFTLRARPTSDSDA